MKRGSGILLHITSLPSRYGIGDLGTNAYQFADILADCGGSYWQVLPLNPVDTAAGCSPYYSHGGNAGNPLLISPEQLIKDGLLKETDCSHPPNFSSDRVDFDSVISYKLELIEKAYNTFQRRHILTNEYYSFCNENFHWLNDYALFSLLKKEFGNKPWSDWPVPFRRREIPQLEYASKTLADSIEKEKFQQFIFYRQWNLLKSYCNSKGIKMIGDIPIYVSYDSSDVWSYPWIFKLDGSLRPYAVAGVPPDYFSKTGQLWNNPVYRWEALKESRYEWWVNRFRLMFKNFDIVRIDHFRGMVQYWEIPAGETTAVNGKWQDVPVYDFFDTLIERFKNFPIIAEDLGIITDDVREVMRHYGFAGMKVLLFAFGEDNPHHPYLPCNFTNNCVVYTGTHDNNTVIGWLKTEASAEERNRLYRYLGNVLEPKETVWKLIEAAIESVADVAIIPMQDILCLDESARMNTPSKAMGNWIWRMTPEQLKSPNWQKWANLNSRYNR